MNIKDIEQNRDYLIDSLVKEENELLKKIEKSRKDNDYGLYKNLIRALTDVTTLKQRELANIPRAYWQDMYSYHKMEQDGKFIQVVSTWKQKGEDIKDHHIYKIEKEIADKPLKKIYIDVSRDSNYPSRIYCDGTLTPFNHKTMDILADYIYTMYKNDNVEVYADSIGLGNYLIDILNIKGIKAKSIKIEKYN